MGAPVPADDLPSSIVPADDLPASPAQAIPRMVDSYGRPYQDDIVQKTGRFIGDAAQSGGRMLMNAATAVPGMFADAAASGYNLLRGREAPTPQQTAAGQGGDYPFPVLPSQDFRQRLSPALGQAPTGAPGIAEDIGSAVIGAKLPLPGVAPAESAASGLSPNLQKIADRGEKLGLQTTPGQASANPTLQKVEAAIEAKPVTSLGFDELKTRNTDVVNKKWADAIGEVNSKAPDAETMGNAAKRTGDIFESVRDANPRAIPPAGQAGSVSDAVVEQAKLLRGISGGDTFLGNPLVQDLLQHAQAGEATGKELGNLSSQLGKSAYNEMSTATGNREVGKALYAIKNKVDDLVQQGLSDFDKGDYVDARKQYRTLMQLQESRAVNSASGTVNGPMMARYLQRTDKNGYLYGKNDTDHYAATRFAQAFAPTVGNSGTATRLFKLTDIPEHVLGAVFSKLYLNGGKAAVKAGASLPTMRNLYQAAPAFKAAVDAQMQQESQGQQQ